MPKIVCKGCGIEKPSIMSHLRSLSCRVKYTNEELDNFQLQADEVYNLNKRHDPVLKERAKKLKKAWLKKEKLSEELDSTSDDADKPSPSITNNKDTSSKTEHQNHSSKRQRETYSPTYTEENTQKRIRCENDTKAEGVSINIYPSTSGHSQKETCNTTKVSNNFDEKKQIVKQPKGKQSDQYQNIERKFNKNHQTNPLNSGTNTTKENISTTYVPKNILKDFISAIRIKDNLNEKDQQTIYENHHQSLELSRNQNKDLIKKVTINTDSSNDVSILENNYKNEEEPLSFLISMLHDTATEKLKSIEDNINTEIKPLTDNLVSEEFESNMKNLTTQIQMSMMELKEKQNSTFSQVKEIAKNVNISHATEKITQVYHKLFMKMDNHQHSLKLTIKNMTELAMNDPKATTEKKKEHLSNIDKQNHKKNCSTQLAILMNNNVVKCHDMSNEMKSIITNIDNDFKEACEIKNERKNNFIKDKFLKHYQSLINCLNKQKKIMKEIDGV